MNSFYQKDYLNKPEHYYGSLRPEMQSFIPTNVRNLLDVGCSNGGFGGALRKSRQIHVTGVELNSDAANQAVDQLDRVIHENAEHFPYSEYAGEFDCITFNDILEHLVDPWAVLRAAKEALSPNGIIIASLPNVRHFEVIKDLVFRGQWTYVSEGVLDRTHLRFFTRSSGVSLFEDSGLQVIKAEGINGAPFPWKFDLLNKCLFGKLDDMRYIRFAYISKPI
jgi:2-polyprenyl-3-methyl-5-hydroxy-6-metoxy-1,4-benzoquinol methylase